jgi:hypothetical protein
MWYSIKEKELKAGRIRPAFFYDGKENATPFRAALGKLL